MTETAPQSTEDEPLIFDRLPRVAEIEIDRFCDGCGYNLRTQAVRRDPRTEILLCRCPECARFHAATDQTTIAHPWLRRLAALLLVLWVSLIAGGVITLAIIEGAITVTTIEDLGRSRYVYNYNRTRQRQYHPIQKLPLYATREYPRYHVEIGLMAALSLGTGFGGVALATVVCPHWPRWGYRLYAIGLPLLVALFVWAIFRLDSPRYLQWCNPYIMGHALIQILAGIPGMVTGRPLARLIIRITMSQRLRQALAFLWLVDGKSPPATASPQLP